MSIITNLAIITITIGTIKILSMLLIPKEFTNLSRNLLSKPKLLQIASLVLAGAVLYYLLQAQITILEIFAVMLFVNLLTGAIIAPMAQPMMKTFDAKKWMKENKLALLSIIFLLAWGIKELFF